MSKKFKNSNNNNFNNNKNKINNNKFNKMLVTKLKLLWMK